MSSHAFCRGRVSNGDARARTGDALHAVRRRAAAAAALRVTSHAAFGAVFGTVLAATGDAGPWLTGALAAAGAAAAALWAGARLPRVEAGRLIERRFPDCRNVLVTADEVLTGALDVPAAAAERVFARAAMTLDGIDVRRAVDLARPASRAVLAVAASAVTVLWIRR